MKKLSIDELKKMQEFKAPYKIINDSPPCQLFASSPRANDTTTLNIRERKFADEEIVMARLNPVTTTKMVVISGSERLISWKYELGFLTKSGKPHKRRGHWWLWEYEINKLNKA